MVDVQGNVRLDEVLMHPVRLRLVSQVAGRELTTAQLREAMPDVTAATLYRHVATLIDAGILAVVRERRVRGAVERTLALGGRAARLDAAELRQLSTDELRRAFAVFLAHLAADVDRFLETDSAGEGEVRDLMGFGQVPLRVTVDDLGDLQQELQAVLQRYVDTGQGDKPRVVLSTVLLPETAP